MVKLITSPDLNLYDKVYRNHVIIENRKNGVSVKVKRITIPKKELEDLADRTYLAYASRQFFSLPKEIQQNNFGFYGDDKVAGYNNYVKMLATTKPFFYHAKKLFDGYKTLSMEVQFGCYGQLPKTELDDFVRFYTLTQKNA